jgi:transglutaminase-like putative cysteine protease
MEVRMQPRTEAMQRCLNFQLSVFPRARVASYRDYLGNSVHHFNVPGQHRQLLIVAEALVDVRPPEELPSQLGPGAWAELDSMINGGDYWEMLMPSQFARPSKECLEFAVEVGFHDREKARQRDLLELLLDINATLFSSIAYVPSSTSVDSPIEHALRERKGVCQDYAHIMITLVRHLGIPARYVSGYLFHRSGDHTRSSEGATHAWVEALVPGFGWVGFDPTNNVLVNDRHVRTAVGRDYADVPPSRGVYNGSVKSELTVRVRVAPSDAPPPAEEENPATEEWRETVQEEVAEISIAAQQQQQ